MELLGIDVLGKDDILGYHVRYLLKVKPGVVSSRKAYFSDGILSRDNDKIFIVDAVKDEVNRLNR